MKNGSALTNLKKGDQSTVEKVASYVMQVSHSTFLFAEPSYIDCILFLKLIKSKCVSNLIST